MWKRRADTAAVEVDDLAVLTAGEDDAPAEGVAAMIVDQTYASRPTCAPYISRNSNSPAAMVPLASLKPGLISRQSRPAGDGGAGKV